MNFLSWQFAAFAAVVLFLYYLPLFRQIQVQILIVGSLYFFAYADARFLPLLLVAVLGTQYCLIKAMQLGRIWMIAGVVLNLGLLAFFKYKFLFLGPAVQSAGDSSPLGFLLALPLPIGISFFVFHNISMLVDFTKRRDTTAAPPLSHILIYILFFPQLVSGPITKAKGFFPQITPKFLRDVDFVSAARWTIAGYFMKSFCANNLNHFTSFMNSEAGLASLAGIDRVFLVVLYSFQIYADFFGYSSIAVGLALLFGYRLPLNFNLPYLSSSLHDFWNRWHISLSSWLKTYLYFPLGGNRKGPVRTYFNLMAVMSLGGLWHGASINYLVWGAFHGLLLCIERPFLHHDDGGKRPAPPWLTAIRTLIVFGLVSGAWLLFKFPTFGEITAYVAGIIDNPRAAFHSPYFFVLGTLYCLPVLLQHALGNIPRSPKLAVFEPALYAAMVFLSIVEAGPETTFIYFRF